MTKKILGIVLATVFIGIPFFAIAVEDPCATANSFDAPPGCANPGGGSNTVAPANGGSNTVAPATGGNPLAVSAQLKNPIKFNTFSDFVAQVTKTAVEILSPFVVLAFIWSGFLFVRAQGNETELANAKKNIWYSVIGAFILMGAWGFATMISETVQTLTK